MFSPEECHPGSTTSINLFGQRTWKEPTQTQVEYGDTEMPKAKKKKKNETMLVNLRNVRDSICLSIVPPFNLFNFLLFLINFCGERSISQSHLCLTCWRVVQQFLRNICAIHSLSAALFQTLWDASRGGAPSRRVPEHI